MTTKKAALSVSGNSNDNNKLSVHGATFIANAADTQLSNATTTLANLNATVASAKSIVDELGSRIIRTATEISELKTLVNMESNGGTAGELDDAYAKRLEVYNAFIADGGEKKLAEAEKAAADAAVNETRSGDLEADGQTAKKDAGALWEADQAAANAWSEAKGVVQAKQGELTQALDGADLVALRQAVTEKTGDWTTANNDLTDERATLADLQGKLDAAVADQAAAELACQLKAYDDYRSTLEDELEGRAADLKAIKALLEKAKAEAPARGQAGARCEKALSNGTFRPARGEQTCAEGLCCGAARVWMSAGDGVKNAAWRTVETCQAIDT